MGCTLKIFGMLIVGTALGLATTWATAIRGGMGVNIRNGPWHTSLFIGSSEGSPYLRTRVASHALLALNREEAMYYYALTDSKGEALDGKCSYLIKGNDPPTRWWSITAYGADDFVIPNNANLYSVSIYSVRHEADGSFVVSLSRDKTGSNWLPVAPGPFDLTLRLYNPDPAIAADPTHVALPVIEKWTCE
jgi:hypothetical protein